MLKTKLLGLLPLLAILLLSWFPDNPPTGYTGAPLATGGNEPTCTICHTPPATQPFAGNISISGLPATINANQTYPITVTITKTEGNPVLAGFEIVALNSSLGNAGSIVSNGANTGVESSGGRTYVEHRPAQPFSGNTVVYTFEWKAPGSPTSDVITFYAVGNIASGSNGNQNDLIVTTSQSGTLTGGADPLEASITSSSNVSCNGGMDGSATVVASGGSGSYTYTWSDGETMATATTLSAGLATVTVSDGATTTTASVTITEPPALNVSIIAQTNIDCFVSIGSATAAATGGTPGYSYEWDNGETTAMATNLTAGMHSVTVTDANECTGTASVLIESSTNPPVANAGPDWEICQGNTVTLSAFATGGSTPYTYVWSNGLGAGADKDVSPATTTTYTVTVTGSNGCFDTDEVTVFVFPNPTLSLGSTTCSADLQTYTIVVNSDAEQVTVLDSNNQNVGTITDNGDGTFTITNVPAGENVTVLALNASTADCMNEISVTAPDCSCPAIAPPSAEGPTTVSICEGQGIPTFMAFSTAGYAIDWYDAATGGNLLASNTTVFTPTMAGTYYAEARDMATGCVSDTRTAFTLTINSSPVANAGFDVNMCEGNTQTITAMASGGNPPYTYSWNQGLNDGASHDISPATTTTYTVTVTDGNGCSDTDEVTVFVFPNPTLSLGSTTCSADLQTYTIVVNSDAEQVTVLDGNNQNVGTITDNGDGTFTITNIPSGENVTVLALNASTADCMNEISVTAPDCNCPDIAAPSAEGPTEASICQGQGVPTFVAFSTAGYAIDWYDAATGGNLLASNTMMFTPTTAGTYFAEARDPDTGCVSQTRLAFTLTILPGIDSITFSGDTFICQGGTASITASAQGGTPPYSYLWSTGSGSATNSVTPTDTTTYCVTVTDNNGCTATDCVTVNVNPEIIVALNITNESGVGTNDGAITVNVTGGTPPYTYLWNLNNITTQSLTGLSPGTYTVTVTDASGCTATGIGTVLAGGCPDIAAPSAEGPTEASICEGQGIPTFMAFSTAGYAIDWYDAATGGNLLASNTTVFTPTMAGTYYAEARDTTTDCVSDNRLAFTLTVFPGIDDIVFSGSTTICAGETASITASAQGGTPPYSYVWDNGMEAMTMPVAPLETTTYCVTVTDLNGCVKSDCVTIEVNPLPEVLIDNLSFCEGYCVIVTISQDSSTIMWSNGQAGSEFTTCQPGSYEVTVTNESGCTNVTAFEVVELPLPVVEIAITDESASGQSDGIATANPIDTVGVYSYEWTDDTGAVLSTTNTLDHVPAGEYLLSVTDTITGCQQEYAVIIDVMVTTRQFVLDANVNVAPNPVADLLFITIDYPNLKEVSLEFYNLQGQLITREHSDTAKTELDVSGYTDGLYLLKIVADGEIAIKKVIISK